MLWQNKSVHTIKNTLHIKENKIKSRAFCTECNNINPQFIFVITLESSRRINHNESDIFHSQGENKRGGVLWEHQRHCIGLKLLNWKLHYFSTLENVWLFWVQITIQRLLQHHTLIKYCYHKYQEMRSCSYKVKTQPKLLPVLETQTSEERHHTYKTEICERCSIKNFSHL